MGKKVRDKTIRNIIDAAWNLHNTFGALDRYYNDVVRKDYTDEHEYSVQDLRLIRDHLRRAEMRANRFVNRSIPPQEWEEYMEE